MDAEEFGNYRKKKMSLKMEDNRENREKIAETEKRYEQKVDEILASDPGAFADEISQEDNLSRLDSLLRPLAWEWNRYAKKKDKESMAYRRRIADYLSPLRARFNALKPKGIPPSDQEDLTNLKRNIS